MDGVTGLKKVQQQLERQIGVRAGRTLTLRERLQRQTC